MDQGRLERSLFTLLMLECTQQEMGRLVESWLLQVRPASFYNIQLVVYIKIFEGVYEQSKETIKFSRLQVPFGGMLSS